MAAGATYEPIATATLGSLAVSYTFSSIPATYTDLVLVVNAKATSGTTNNYLTIGNGTVDTGANYSRTKLSGDGTSGLSDRNSNASGAYLDAYGDTNNAQFDSVQFAHIMNYSNTTTYKTILCRANRVGGGVDAIVNLWRSTDAINIITVNSSGTYAIGSTFTLYGIAAA
jgi:hypothetical protein